MNEEVVSIPSAGLHLHGIVRVPDGLKSGERRAAFLVLHGFGGNSNRRTPCSRRACSANTAM